MSNQSAVTVLCGVFNQMQEWLAGTMEGVTDDLAHHDPPGSPSPIGAQAAQIVASLDYFMVEIAAGEHQLLTNSFADKSGMSEPLQIGGDWSTWGLCVKIDLPACNRLSTLIPITQTASIPL